MHSLKFATKVWLTSVFLSPILLFFYFLMQEDNIKFEPEIFEFYGLFIFFGGLFSIPNWLLFAFGISLVRKKDWGIIEKKMVIQFISIVLSFLLYLIFSRLVLGAPPSLNFEFAPFLFCYVATLTLGIWYFHLDVPSRPIIPDENILDEEF